jgi:CRP-like cAMP-binding protein
VFALFPNKERAVNETSTSTTSIRNRLLASLSPTDLGLLEPDLEPIELPVRQVLEAPNMPISHSFFIESGLASIIAGNRHKRLEVGLIGCDGMTGLPIVLGNDRSPHETFIQVAGEGRRIAADKLRRAMEQSRSLERAFLECAHAFMNQTANTALSNGTATLEERLARWLLMADDRLEGNEVPLTHEFLSLMLGVRRAGVTVALNYLEQRGVIQLARGHIIILERAGLAASANGSYHQPETQA